MRRSGVAGAIRHRVRTELPTPAQATLSRAVFVMIKADALASGRASAVANFICGRGAQLLEATLWQAPQPQLFEDLYRFNLSFKNEDCIVGSWRLNSRLYSSGPTVAMLILGPPEVDDVHGWVKAMKGASAPHLAAPGTLRADLGATNRTLNLFHAADDVLSTVREYLIFSDMQRLACALARADDAAAGDRVRAELDLMIASVAGRPQDLSTPRLLWRLKTRAIMAWRARDALPTLSLLTEALDREWRQYGRPRSRAHEVAILRLASREQAALLEAMDGREGAYGRVLASLLDLTALSESRAEAVLAEFEHLEIPFNRWEALILLSSCHYGQDWSQWLAQADDSEIHPLAEGGPMAFQPRRGRSGRAEGAADR